MCTTGILTERNAHDNLWSLLVSLSMTLKKKICSPQTPTLQNIVRKDLVVFSSFWLCSFLHVLESRCFQICISSVPVCEVWSTYQCWRIWTNFLVGGHTCSVPIFVCGQEVVPHNKCISRAIGNLNGTCYGSVLLNQFSQLAVPTFPITFHPALTFSSFFSHGGHKAFCVLSCLYTYYWKILSLNFHSIPFHSPQGEPKEDALTTLNKIVTPNEVVHLSHLYYFKKFSILHSRNALSLSEEYHVRRDPKSTQLQQEFLATWWE